LPGNRILAPQQFIQRPGGDDLASANAGARPEVDDKVRASHRLLVVLDDDERISA